MPDDVFLSRMLELAEDLFSEDQCSLGLRHWTRPELESYVRRAAELAELVLEVYTRPEDLHGTQQRRTHQEHESRKTR